MDDNTWKLITIPKMVYLPTDSLDGAFKNTGLRVEPSDKVEILPGSRRIRINGVDHNLLIPADNLPIDANNCLRLDQPARPVASLGSGGGRAFVGATGQARAQAQGAWDHEGASKWQGDEVSHIGKEWMQAQLRRADKQGAFDDLDDDGLFEDQAPLPKTGFDPNVLDEERVTRTVTLRDGSTAEVLIDPSTGRESGYTSRTYSGIGVNPKEAARRLNEQNAQATDVTYRPPPQGDPGEKPFPHHLFPHKPDEPCLPVGPPSWQQLRAIAPPGSTRAVADPPNGWRFVVGDAAAMVAQAEINTRLGRDPRAPLQVVRLLPDTPEVVHLSDPGVATGISDLDGLLQTTTGCPGLPLGSLSYFFGNEVSPTLLRCPPASTCTSIEAAFARIHLRNTQEKPLITIVLDMIEPDDALRLSIAEQLPVLAETVKAHGQVAIAILSPDWGSKAPALLNYIPTLCIKVTTHDRDDRFITATLVKGGTSSQLSVSFPK